MAAKDPLVEAKGKSDRSQYAGTVLQPTSPHSASSFARHYIVQGKWVATTRPAPELVRRKGLHRPRGRG
jgi:hypothetical protein